MSALKARFIGHVVIGVSLFCLCLGIIMTGIAQIVMCILGLILLFVSSVIFWKYWRCASCGETLPTAGSIWLEYCPYCGNPIE